MAIGATIGITLAVERMSKSKGGKGGRIITTASAAGIIVRVFNDNRVKQHNK